MQELTYEQRKQTVFSFLYAKEGGLLRRYRFPEHLQADAVRDEVNLLVEDINGLIPTGYTDGDFRLLLPEINAAVRRRHGAQGWPPAKVFIASTKEAVEATAKKMADGEPKREFMLDPFEITSRRMRDGEPVGEAFLWGVAAIELIARGLVDEQTMTCYRFGVFEVRKNKYGLETATQWETEAKERHRAAKETYVARKRGGSAISPEAMSRIQRDLDAVTGRLDARAQETRRWA